MNASSSSAAQSVLDDEISDALIVQCRLSDEDIERIRTAMHAMHLSFGDAAVSIGVVSANELRMAIDWVNRLSAKRESSLIETALHRQVRTRDLTVRFAGHVRAGSHLVLAHEPDHPRSERLRALRTELLLLLDGGTGRANAVALLSPTAGEGRSQLAAELAIAFSQLGRRTLLVDGDLRRPRQHQLFETENQWGLAQALAFNEAPRILGVEGLPHLSLLIAGLAAPNPLELLSDGRFEQQMRGWRRQYEIIIIDTPPVSEYADALAIATLSGRVLVVSRTRSTAHHDMAEMLRRLANTQSRILGAVMNNF